MVRMRSRRFLLLASMLLALASCSGDAPEAEACDDPTPADTVQLEDFAFEPDCVVAPVGSTIQLENVGDAPHTFTVDAAGIDLDLAAGTTAEASIEDVEPGSYAVTCTYHPQMTATLTVEGQ